jgi:hypothetical protein
MGVLGLMLGAPLAAACAQKEKTPADRRAFAWCAASGLQSTAWVLSGPVPPTGAQTHGSCIAQPRASTFLQNTVLAGRLSGVRLDLTAGAAAAAAGSRQTTLQMQEVAEKKVPPSISWDSHTYVDAAPESLVRDDDLSGANMDMRRRFEANCRRAQVRRAPRFACHSRRAALRLGRMLAGAAATCAAACAAVSVALAAAVGGVFTVGTRARMCFRAPGRHLQGRLGARRLRVPAGRVDA